MEQLEINDSNRITISYEEHTMRQGRVNYLGGSERLGTYLSINSAKIQDTGMYVREYYVDVVVNYDERRNVRSITYGKQLDNIEAVREYYDCRFCEHCHTSHKKSDFIDIPADSNNDVVTTICLKARTQYKCHDCGGYYISVASRGNQHRCSACRAKMPVCPHCGMRLLSEDDFRNKKTQCAHCWNYSQKIVETEVKDAMHFALKSKSLYPYDYTFGVELEAENTSDADSYFQEMRDGSISGLEYVSPNIAVYKYGKQSKVGGLAGDVGVNMIADFCNNTNLIADDACGYHLHLGLPINLTGIGLYRLYFIYRLLDNLLLDLVCSYSRRRWCNNLPKFDETKTKLDFFRKYYNDQYLSAKRLKTRYRNKYPANGNRYIGANFHAYNYVGTLELRYHDGTFDADAVIDWLFLNTAIVDFALSSRTKIDVLRTRWAGDVTGLLQFIIDNSKFDAMTKRKLARRYRVLVSA